LTKGYAKFFISRQMEFPTRVGCLHVLKIKMCFKLVTTRVRVCIMYSKGRKTRKSGALTEEEFSFTPTHNFSQATDHYILSNFCLCCQKSLVLFQNDIPKPHQNGPPKLQSL
jgi:hypothetical protein